MFVGMMQDDGNTQIFEAGPIPSNIKPQTVLLMIGSDSVERIEGLCCTKPLGDSPRESSVIAGWHEQTDTPDL